MKTRLFLPALLGTLTFGAHAADPAPVGPSSAAVEAPAKDKSEDFSKYKSADEFWKRIEELKEQPKVRPKSREEMIAIVSEWYGSQKAAGEAFGKAFPKDPRRHSARLMTLQAALQLAQIPGAAGSKPDTDDLLQEIEKIAGTAEAPEDTKGEAAFILTMTQAQKFNPEDPKSVSSFLKAGDDFLAKHGTHKLAAQMRQIQLQIASEAQTPEAEALLKKFAQDKESPQGQAAAAALAQREKMSALKSKPLDLTFTAADGSKFDIAKLRGKVVLVDFWASWCGPCIGEMPNVVATYGKLHEKGFEIVGISLDQKKDKMEEAMKKHNMTWVQYFDGQGWGNKISTGYGIRSIPAAWLLDRKGVLRETGLRGPALGAAVEKLLAE